MSKSNASAGAVTGAVNTEETGEITSKDRLIARKATGKDMLKPEKKDTEVKDDKVETVKTEADAKVQDEKLDAGKTEAP